MSQCDHKNIDDHSRYIVAPGDIGGKIRVWKCSYCGDESQWTEHHEYYGSVECRRCNMANIEEVRCGNCKRSKKLNVSED